MNQLWYKKFQVNPLQTPLDVAYQQSKGTWYIDNTKTYKYIKTHLIAKNNHIRHNATDRLSKPILKVFVFFTWSLKR